MSPPHSIFFFNEKSRNLSKKGNTYKPIIILFCRLHVNKSLVVGCKYLQNLKAYLHSSPSFSYCIINKSWSKLLSLLWQLFLI